jgi:signal transduction histidine kinase/ligand-binding sensor domain-containing protein
MKNVLLLFFLFNSLTVFAQEKEIKHLLKYSQKEGLPSYNVRKVFQDSKGFIWACTQDGISRFDGHTFINYSKSSVLKHRICGVDVRELFEDSASNLLWILPSETGINAISIITGEVVLTAYMPNTDSEDWNISMVRTEDEIWIGTSTGVKIYNTRKNTFEKNLPLPAGFTASTTFETRSILKDSYGNIWVCYSGHGISIYSNKTKKIIKEIFLSRLNDHRRSNNIQFKSYAIPQKGEILFATSQGLRKINYSPDYDYTIDTHPCRGRPLLNTTNIEYVASNKQNQLFITGYDGLYRFGFELTGYTLINEPGKIAATNWLNAVQCLYEDREGNTWLGCQEGLAFVSKRPGPFVTYNYDPLSNTALEHVRSIYPLDNGDILAGLRNGIVNISQEHGYTKYDTGHLYHHIFQDPNGLIHVARADGMFIYKKGKTIPIRNIYPEFAPYSYCPVNSHLFINDTLIILGTENDNGILAWNPRKKTIMQPRGLASGIVNNIYKDAKGNIWVLSDNVISILTPDLKKSRKFIPAPKGSAPLYKLFFDMCEAGGYYWITSYGSGVLQLDSFLNVKQVFNTEKGLSNDGVYQIYNIENKNILVTSNNGISVLNIGSFKIKSFFSQNGLHANSFEEVSGLMKNGRIYAGGINGFTVIDPRYFPVNDLPPAFYISSIQITTNDNFIDSSNLLLRSIRIPSNILQTTVFFSALNYSDPEGTTIAYKITEQHPGWINIGNNNSLPLIGFSPGTYHLQIRAFNEDGIGSEIKELTLIFLPKWYQTWWFRLSLAFIFVASVYALYRLRINQLKKEQSIRSKLASDLHDDLGSTLNSVKVYANLALMEKERDKNLFKVKESIQEAITGVRDMIWVLDDKRDTIEDLLARVSQFASSLCEANSIRYKTEFTDQARAYKLGRAEKRNLYMILKEAVNNACKYSGATEILIIISLNKKKPEIDIKDNGKGFDTHITSEGNGLKNLKLRTRQIKYDMDITSSPGNGTHIHLQKT